MKRLPALSVSALPTIIVGGMLVFDTFIWSYQRQRKNVLPIILCCQKEMDGDCVLRFPDISTSLFSHAGVSVNSAENKRGI